MHTYYTLATLRKVAKNVIAWLGSVCVYITFRDIIYAAFYNMFTYANIANTRHYSTVCTGLQSIATHGYHVLYKCSVITNACNVQL